MAKGEWYQGVFTPEHPEKCINKTTINYRSSWEKRFCSFLDQSPHCKKWGYEVVTLKYVFQIDSKIHKYIVDFYAEMVNSDNKIDKYLIEIKPKHQSIEPVMPKRKSAKSMKNFMYEAKQYIKNKNKWMYAENFCKANGMTFKILNENTLM